MLQIKLFCVLVRSLRKSALPDRILLLICLFAFHFGNAQQTEVVDFLKVTATVEPDASEEKIRGNVQYTFKILKATDSVYLDAHKMKIIDVALEGVRVKSDENKIWLVDTFEAGREYHASFVYEAFPKQTVYFTGDQIWTQGQGKYTSHWLPSIDDMNDKLEFDLTIISPSEKTAIANGQLESVIEVKGKKFWKYDMKQPMSSYLAAFAIGNFSKEQRSSESGIALEMYFNPEDSVQFEPTYRFTKEIFDFLENEIGVSYPWQNYKQVPVRDFLYAGMENTTLTLFSEAFLVDNIGYNDRNYVNVNAHELAHQWFGNLVTETEGTHHWLQEGFATYYALLAEKELFGEEYYYWKLFQSAEQLKAMSDEGKGEALLNPKASSLTFYEKGAWALHILKEEIGEEAFRQAVKNYLQKYSFKNVKTEDFLTEARAASGKDLKQFETDWLLQAAFKAEQAYTSLMKLPFIEKYFEVAALKTLPLADKNFQLKTALTFPNDYMGQEAIYQLLDEPMSETIPLYKLGFESNNLYVRQAIALTLQTVPKELQKEYESLLDDASYVTMEAALYALWVSFPENRERYLDKMREMVGFQNKNVRELWLVLALIDPNYETDQKTEYVKELRSYTSSDFSFEVRQNAFEYVAELELYDEDVLKNLMNATVHHNWRFKSYARNLLKEVIKKEEYRNLIENLSSGFSKREVLYLKELGF
ncbi:M1 family metallopeptidase [Ulvibacter antarcticus]|uniref:Aminopeptidase N n=1 Tax=Ulvibacter antarcticus TaxID=442714 RepID=A0A3L9YVY8_9FLAO|nr:M1 family metallopeptidase [Ulvibacter antarcticus]RMA58632.1 aminopeptidase N [Ulvibacter antarcticus]